MRTHIRTKLLLSNSMVRPNRLLEDDDLGSSIHGEQSPHGSIYGDPPHRRLVYNDITGEEEAEFTHKSASLENSDEEDDPSPDISS